MNRDIKFRAWDEMNGMTDCFCIHSSGLISYKNNDWLYDNENPIIMQYTGLKDKIGTEIYEGDILYRIFGVAGHLKFLPDGSVTREMIYKDEKYFEVKIPDFYCLMEELRRGYGDKNIRETVSHFEIKGNIYQHPHLLENIK